MDFISLFFVFALGAVIGSFLNVVVLRYNTGKISDGRSMCFSCGKTLAWSELVPILSFFLQKGKCASCNSKISWQYPAVEFLTGIVFIFVFAQEFSGSFSFFDVLNLLASLAIWSLLIAIVVYDMRHKIIPDGLVWSFVGLSFFQGLFLFLSANGWSFSEVWNLPASHFSFFETFIGGEFSTWLLSGPVLATPFALIWLASGGRWMGLGDAKIALGLGFYLGLWPAFSAILLAFWIGAIWGIAVVSLGRISEFYALSYGDKHHTMKSEIPFAPFLIIGMFLVYIWGIDITVLVSKLLLVT
ncbi:MAG: prepilin peptidase [bacterium]|nr:prepilin peptidase [bacterium]